MAVSFKLLCQAYSESLHLGRLYFCPYKKYLKRASTSISKVRNAMTSIAFSYFVISARISLSLRLGDSHPIPRCSKNNILCFYYNRQGIVKNCNAFVLMSVDLTQMHTDGRRWDTDVFFILLSVSHL